MKRIAVVVVAFLAAACSSSSGGSPSLDGTWFYADSAGTAGFGATPWCPQMRIGRANP
jgi:hypothetical protein